MTSSISKKGGRHGDIPKGVRPFLEWLNRQPDVTNFTFGRIVGKRAKVRWTARPKALLDGALRVWVNGEQTLINILAYCADPADLSRRIAARWGDGA